MQDNRSQTIEFKFTGLDQDSDPRLMQSGDSRYRLNCINDSTDDGLLGDIQNPKGNTLYAWGHPPGTNKVIGSAKDTHNNAIIYFVYNSQGFHSIVRFFPDTGVNQLILTDELLNFQPNQRIYSANVINTGNDAGLLYWTDGWFDDYLYDGNGLLQFNPPRKINIQKAIDLGPGYGSQLTFETLDRIKYQPNTPAQLRYLNDPAAIENYLYGKLFQFTYRYIFDDKEVSTWATLSQVLLPTYNYVNNSPFNLLENNIGVTLQSGSEIVTDIEIAIRSSVQNVDGAESYFIVSRLNKDALGIPSNTAYEYIYNGLAYKENLLADDFLRPFDYVPQISRAQDLVAGRIVDWNLIENYDDVDLNVSGSYIRYDKTLNIRTTSPDTNNPSAPNDSPWGALGGNHYPIPTFKQLGLYQYGIVYYDRAGRSGIVNTKDEYLLEVPSWDVGSFPLNGILADPLKMELLISSIPPSWATHWAPVITKDQRYVKKQQLLISQNNFDFANGRLKIPTNSGYVFTPYDTIRLLGYSTASFNFITTPFGSTPDYSDAASFDDYFTNNFYFPPTNYNNNLITQSLSSFNYIIQSFDDATQEIVLSKNDTIDIKNYFADVVKNDFDFIQANYFMIIEIYNTDRDTTANKVFYEVGMKFEVGDANLPTRYHKSPDGDQAVGIISVPATINIYGFDCYLRYKKNILDDYPILFTNPLPAGGGVFQFANIHYPTSYLPYFKGAILTNADVIYFDGTTSNGYHINDNIGFDLPYLILYFGPFVTYLQINSGVYVDDPSRQLLYAVMLRAQLEIFPWLEDDAFADDYPSVIYNDGRVNTNLQTLGRTDYIARGRWSGKLFENTLENNLSRVLFSSYRDLSNTFNQVSRIRQVGDTLKVRQKTKLTSFYIDKNVLTVSSGLDSVGVSDDFLSSPNVYDEIWGSSSPGCDIQDGHIGYFIDLLRGVVIRDAGNKPITISGDDDSAKDMYKMSKYFRNLFKQIRTAGEENFNIIGAWDEFSSLYTFTVQDLRDDSPLSQTIVFHEPTNRWKSFMSYIPEWYETLGKFVISFKDGQPYVHYTNALRNNFYGVQYGQQINVTANIGRNTIKVFDNLDVYSNIAWEIPTINIPASANYPNGMLSRIPAAKFVAKEGVWHAPFLRDINDPKYSASAIVAVMNGRRLRGETIELIMTNTSTDLVYLKALNIFINPSELTI